MAQGGGNGGARGKLYAQEGPGLRDYTPDNIPPGAGGAISEGPKMEISIEKYLDIRFAHLEGNLNELRSDVRELRGFKLWIVGTGIASFIGVILIIIGTIGILQSELSGIRSQMSLYQSQLNAQMQTFTEYVKEVTQPQPSKGGTPSKK